MFEHSHNNRTVGGVYWEFYRSNFGTKAECVFRPHRRPNSWLLHAHQGSLLERQVSPGQGFVVGEGCLHVPCVFPANLLCKAAHPSFPLWGSRSPVLP